MTQEKGSPAVYTDALYWTAVSLAALVVMASYPQPQKAPAICPADRHSERIVLQTTPAPESDEVLKDMKLHD